MTCTPPAPFAKPGTPTTRSENPSPFRSAWTVGCWARAALEIARNRRASNGVRMNHLLRYEWGRVQCMMSDRSVRWFAVPGVEGVPGDGQIPRVTEFVQATEVVAP